MAAIISVKRHIKAEMVSNSFFKINSHHINNLHYTNNVPTSPSIPTLKRFLLQNKFLKTYHTLYFVTVYFNISIFHYLNIS